MTAIEVLSEKIMRPDNEIKVLDRLAEKMSEMEIDEKTKNSIAKALSSIRTQSISKSCKAIVRGLLGKKDAELFYALYDYRSQLVHSGTLSNGQDEMYKIHLQCYSLAKKLLVAYVENVAKNSDFS
jgi:hypothetical protein